MDLFNPYTYLLNLLCLFVDFLWGSTDIFSQITSVRNNSGNDYSIRVS